MHRLTENRKMRNREAKSREKRAGRRLGRKTKSGRAMEYAIGE